MVRSATTIVATCVRDPNAADYRRDVRDLIPAICGKLVEYSAPEKAITTRRETLLKLQPLGEQNPENEALLEVIGVIRAIEVPSAPPTS